MKNILITTLIILLAFQDVRSEIYSVIQDGSGDFIIIQEAIDFATTGDTILIYPGEYYENLILNSKSLVIGSLYINTQDESFINQTIINGNQEGSCIIIDSENTFDSELIGLVITNGSGSINLSGSTPCGGGVILLSTNITIKSCIITKNNSFGGGGVYVAESSSLTLLNTTISDNHAYYFGGGLNVREECNVYFDQDAPCSIYMNSAGVGTDFHILGLENNLNIYLDTATVNPLTPYYALSRNSVGVLNDYLQIETQHAILEPAHADLYVSPDGDNSNSGLSIDAPLKNIYYALLLQESDSLNQYSIFLSPGTYSQTLSQERFPINCKNYTKLIGLSDNAYSIFDADMRSKHLTGNNFTHNLALRNIRLINGQGNYNTYTGIGVMYCEQKGILNFNNVIIEDNYGSDGLVLIARFDTLTMTDVIIRNNYGDRALKIYSGLYDTAYLYAENLRVINNHPDDDPVVGTGGGMQIVSYHYPSVAIIAELVNCEISNNVNNENFWIPNTGGLTIAENAHATIVNTTITNNTCLGGGGGGISYGSTCKLYNSIVWGNQWNEIYVENGGSESSVTVNYSTIEGGEAGIYSYGNNSIDHGDENNDQNPYFTSWFCTEFGLNDDSPCIDAGSELIEGISLPDTDLAGFPRIFGSRPDHGAYEFQNNTSHESQFSSKSIIIYPNPANDYINIVTQRNELNKAIEIYNSQGQLKEVTYVNGVNPYYHSVKSYDSGIYWLRYKSDIGKVNSVRFVVL
jgi:hypothetical protein